MVGRAIMQFDFQRFEDVLPKLASKNSIPICHNCYWEAMQLEYIVHKELGYCLSSKWVWQGQEMRIFSESINYYQYDILVT
jgi:hypothetical protein